MDIFTSLGTWCSGPGQWHGSGMVWQSWMPFHFGGLLQILLIGIVAYFLIKAFRRPTTTTGPASAEDILKRRYATGEIDKETFDRMKNDMR